MGITEKDREVYSWRQRLPGWAGWVYTFAAVFCLLMIPLRYTTGHGISRFTFLVLTTLGVPSTATLGTAVLLAFLALLCFSRKRIGVIILIALQTLHALLTLIGLLFDLDTPLTSSLTPLF